MNRNVEEDVMEIDIKEIFKLLLGRVKLIIMITILFGVGGFLISKYLITPVYTAGVTMYVNSNKNDISGNISYNDITTSEKLVVAYGKLILSTNVLEKVAEQTGLGYTALNIKGMISIPSDETQILTVVVSNHNAKHAQIIANAIADVAPKKITDFVEGSAMKVVDYAEEPLAPSSPNVTKNTMLGLMLGLIVSIAIIILIEMLDTRIKTEGELASILGIPVIGIIPEIVVKDTKVE